MGKLGGGFKYFFNFQPYLGKDSHFDDHIFQMGINLYIGILGMVRLNPHSLRVGPAKKSSNSFDQENLQPQTKSGQQWCKLTKAFRDAVDGFSG